MGYNQSGGAVDSVFGRTGIIASTSGDYNASQVSNTPAGNITAITAQAAINELDTAKAAANHTHVGLAQGNFAATTDPTIANDNTQGYVVGSVWINTSSHAVYRCLSANTNAAQWTITSHYGLINYAGERTFRPIEGDPPATNFATLGVRGGESMLRFAQGTQNDIIFTSATPDGWDANVRSIAIELLVAAATDTTGTIAMQGAIEDSRIRNRNAADAFAASRANSVGANVTAGKLSSININFLSSHVAGIYGNRMFRLKISTDIANSTIVGDIELYLVRMRFLL